MRIAIAFVLFAVPLQDKKPDPPKVDQNRIDAAIDKGAKFLIDEAKKGLADVKHPNGGGDISEDEIVFYTLIHAGVDPADATFQKLLDRLLTKKLEKTYAVSLLAMSLESFDRKKYQYRIAQCAQFLVDNQCKNGQWGYGEEVPLDKKEPPKKDVATGGAKPAEGGAKGGKTDSLPLIPIKKRSPGPDKGDNSNAQYAALGMRACLQASINIPQDVLVLAVKWWEGNQCSDGSWGYGYEGSQDSSGYGSMTAGATGALIIYRHFLKLDYKRDPKVLKGMDWIGKNFTEKENPKYQEPRMWHLYWLYAVERVGILFGTEKLGSHEWYVEGAKHLLDAQKENGSWRGMSLGGDVADTCFAILFLRRATKPLPKVATGK